MKNANPRILALINALILTAIFIVIYTLIGLLFHEFNFYYLLIISVPLFVSSYFLFKYSIEKFIYAKIKLIYKTIHEVKTPKDSHKMEKTRSIILEQVNQEVQAWAENKREEIKELKELEAYRREFIGNVSHELKTPIFNIQGYVLTLLDGGLEDKSINREYLLRTEKSINRMIDIINDLDIISKLESGKLVLKFQKIDLVNFVKEIIEFYEIRATEKGKQIYLARNYDKPIYVSVDKEKIRQVFDNLIDNSIKYGHREHGKTKISFFDMDQYILVEVTDNGIGIAQEDLPRIFERFYRTDKGRARDQRGSGLGLSIVKHIIEAHNQNLNVRSSPGIGTTFAFTLNKA